MTDSAQHEVTQLLQQWSEGDVTAIDKLIPLIYDELRRQAANYMRRERPGQSLQTTALVHEAYLRLVDQRAVEWQNRNHFFGIAAKLMRRILVDHARQHQAVKRGGTELKLLPLDDAATALAGEEIDLVALDEALTRLALLDEQQSRVVELRFFSGLSVEETAEVLGVSTRSVKREWRSAKAWLRTELSKGEHV
ncbi:MAG TPA: sigma-70 family RNA polymerase sigma factor [Pyrinomonadaceae bacterium]|jgi:RNA polymerase sigma factor (TIGR02999 family)|nr:sigma-70 family RNA polymerase sigma factor [Pyrinomonadaceae bacterium]